MDQVGIHERKRWAAAAAPAQAGVAWYRSRWAPKALPRVTDVMKAGLPAGVGFEAGGGFCGRSRFLFTGPSGPMDQGGFASRRPAKIVGVSFTGYRLWRTGAGADRSGRRSGFLCGRIRTLRRTDEDFGVGTYWWGFVFLTGDTPRQ